MNRHHKINRQIWQIFINFLYLVKRITGDNSKFCIFPVRDTSLLSFNFKMLLFTKNFMCENLYSNTSAFRWNDVQLPDFRMISVFSCAESFESWKLWKICNSHVKRRCILLAIQTKTDLNTHISPSFLAGVSCCTDKMYLRGAVNNWSCDVTNNLHVQRGQLQQQV